MTILSKTLADLNACYVSSVPVPLFQPVFMQIIPPNLYCLMRSNSDGHIEAWSVSP